MYNLNSNTIYKNDHCLFVANGDHNLIEISGDSVLLAEYVIEGFKTEVSPDVVFDKLKNAFDNDRSYFDEICEWLVNNRIIEQVNDQLNEKISVPTYIVNISNRSNPLKAHKELSESSNLFQYNFIEEPNCDKAELILIFAPLFENLNEVLHINQFAYEKKIPLCHIGVDSSSVFTLGPLVYSELRTPCLNCYTKRKLTNLKKPSKTLSFIQHSNKEIIYQSDLSKSNYAKIALMHLRIELDKFFRSRRRFSSLLGKSLVFDNNDYSIVKATLLKVPDCPICNSSQNYSPFNI
jgi:hypothetical protein